MYSAYHCSLAVEDDLKADAIDILRAVLSDGVSLQVNSAKDLDFSKIREQYHSLRSVARKQVIKKLRERYVDLPMTEKNDEDSKQLQVIKAMIGKKRARPFSEEDDFKYR